MVRERVVSYDRIVVCRSYRKFDSSKTMRGTWSANELLVPNNMKRYVAIIYTVYCGNLSREKRRGRGRNCSLFLLLIKGLSRAAFMYIHDHASLSTPLFCKNNFSAAISHSSVIVWTLSPFCISSTNNTLPSSYQGENRLAPELVYFDAEEKVSGVCFTPPSLLSPTWRWTSSKRAARRNRPSIRRRSCRLSWSPPDDNNWI